MANMGQIFKGTGCICNYLKHVTFYQSKHSRQIYCIFFIYLNSTKTLNKNMQSCSLILRDAKDNLEQATEPQKIF